LQLSLGDLQKDAFSVIGTGQIMPVGKEGIVSQGSVKVVILGKEADMLCIEARKAIAYWLNFLSLSLWYQKDIHYDHHTHSTHDKFLTPLNQ